MRHFINIASFGIGGLVDRYVNQSSKTFGGKVSFAVATLKAGAKYKNATVRLVLDGGPAKEGKIYNVAVANGRYFGGGMKVAPDAAPRRRLVRRRHARRLRLRRSALPRPRHLQRQAPQEPEGHRAPRAQRSRPTPVDGAAEVLLDVDGEAPGRLPATFELLARRIASQSQGVSERQRASAVSEARRPADR